MINSDPRIENRRLIYAYEDERRLVEICEIEGYRFRVLVHRLGNSISVWNRMNTDWGFVHSIDGPTADYSFREIFCYLLTVAIDVVGVGRHE